MTVILNDIGIFYASVPKVACTSLKQFFFQIENGFEFRMYKRNGRTHHIHNVYPAILRQDFPEKRLESLHRVTVVREPVVRLLSAYSNRVLHHKELSMEKAGKMLQKLGLKADPDLNQFVDHLDEYCQASASINHHTRPMVDFLGQDLSYFDKVYRMSELAIFEEDMNQVAGTDLRMPHAQRGGPRVTKDQLTAAQISKLEQRYQEDYRAFGAYF